jgi:hypothetical protein
VKSPLTPRRELEQYSTAFLCHKMLINEVKFKVYLEELVRIHYRNYRKAVLGKGK